MEQYQERVQEEKKDLDEKREKLAAFKNTEVWKSLPEAERERMEKQERIMGEYSDVLEDRIENFPN